MKRLPLPRPVAVLCAAAVSVPLLAASSPAVGPSAAVPSAVRAAVPSAVRVVVPASANDCPGGVFCFFYNSHEQGSHNALSTSVPNLAGYTFTSPGNGQGKGVKNNAASAVNHHRCGATVFYNSNYAGPSDSFPSGRVAQLVNTYNQNASLYFAAYCF